MSALSDRDVAGNGDRIASQRGVTDYIISAIPPDLVVEILSPGDRQVEIDRKIAIYLEGGVRVVWIVISDLEQIVQYLPGTPPRRFTTADSLDGGDVLPGFSMPVAALFGE